LVNFFTSSRYTGGRYTVRRLLLLRRVMAKSKRDFSLEAATKSLQENISGAGGVASASYTLVGSIILLGGLGYLADSWRGTSPWFLLAGLILGMVVGFWELVKAVFWK
jgi:F0F1-type ATP synthase assembly protein I